MEITLVSYLRLCTIENILNLFDTKNKFLRIQFLQRVRFINIFFRNYMVLETVRNEFLQCNETSFIFLYNLFPNVVTNI